jgi:N6-L-threonylcarbamoyladenine synthase
MPAPVRCGGCPNRTPGAGLPSGAGSRCAIPLPAFFTDNGPALTLNILGIESSCDETAAAVVNDRGQVLASVVASQIDVHHVYGGVVPELASRKHIEAIGAVVGQALSEAALVPGRIDAVAATQGPGLVGALLVGFSFAKAFAFARKIPFLGIDHLEGHLYSVQISHPSFQFPYAALLASGGHTGIYLVDGPGHYRLLGQTRDDAVGEAYDKVAKMMGLGYPGGAVIDQLACRGNPDKVKFKRPYLNKSRFDFSFSGIKTAASRHIQHHGGPLEEAVQADIAAGFQAAVIDVLVHKLLTAADVHQCERVTVVGGVAANQGLRRKLTAMARGRGIGLTIPDLSLCGDNAAMIAAVAHHHLRSGHTTPLDADVYSRHRVKPQ